MRSAKAATRWLAASILLLLGLCAVPASAQPPAEEPAAADPAPSSEPCDCPPERPSAERAPASQHPKLIVEARAALEELRYDSALALLERIGPTDVAAIRLQALEIEAVVHLIEGRSAVAQPLLEELYFLAPAFVLDDPSLPPRVTKMFAEEAARPHKRAVQLALRPHGADLRGYALSAGGATVRVELACASVSGGPSMPVVTRLAKGAANFQLPNFGRFRCHAVAVDRDGMPLGRFGTQSAPEVVASRPPPPAPVVDPDPAFYETWWFWSITGAVVAGGVVAIVVGTSQEQDLPDSDLTVELAPGAATIWRW